MFIQSFQQGPHESQFKTFIILTYCNVYFQMFKLKFKESLTVCIICTFIYVAVYISTLYHEMNVVSYHYNSAAKLG